MTGQITQGVAWVSEYSGNDSTWKVYRTTRVYHKRRRTYELCYI